MFGKLVACLASMQQNVSHTKGQTFKIIVIHYTPRACTFVPIAKSFTQCLILICYLKVSWKQAKAPCFLQNGKSWLVDQRRREKESKVNMHQGYKKQGERAPGLQEARRSCTVRCTSCKEFGHNKRTCQGAAVGSAGRSKGKKGQNVSWYMFGLRN